MTRAAPILTNDQALTAYFWSGDAMRSRSVSGVVLSSVIDIPVPSARLVADWERDTLDLNLEPGDVEALQLARTRARWPGYKHCVQSMANWTHGQGLGGVLTDSDIALMVCRGARYHNDAPQYAGAAFCNLFLSEDKGLDLHFPALGLRLPLQRGLAVVFDTGQPHAVIPRSASNFEAAAFATGQDCSQFFLTWELPIENASVARALRIAFDTDPATARTLSEAQVRLQGARVAVEPETGGWCRRWVTGSVWDGISDPSG